MLNIRKNTCGKYEQTSDRCLFQENVCRFNSSFFFVSCFWLLGFCVLLFQFIYSIQIDQLLILFCSVWMFKICLNAYTCCCLHEIIAQPLFIHRKYGKKKVPSCCLRQVTATIFWGPIHFFFCLTSLRLHSFGLQFGFIEFFTVVMSFKHSRWTFPIFPNKTNRWNYSKCGLFRATRKLMNNCAFDLYLFSIYCMCARLSANWIFLDLVVTASIVERCRVQWKWHAKNG